MQASSEGLCAAVRLPAASASASAARRFVALVLDEWEIPRAIVEVATLLVSELTGNAVRHGLGLVTVTARHDPRWLRVEVHDDSRTLPVRRPSSLEDESGRGIWLVDALAGRWGTQAYADDGKDVWFELDTAPADGQDGPAYGSLEVSAPRSRVLG